MAILTLDNIHRGLIAKSQVEVFQAIANTAVKNGYATHADAVIQGLKDREKESTTGFLDGFAIPHTKNAAIQRPGIIVQTMENGVEWSSMDGQPVKIAIAMLIPESEAGTAHLNYLSKIAKMLMHEEVRKQLTHAQNEQEIFDILSQYLGE
ncbi:PTS sugar transporter subunit IIA [Caenibacillus caldisaponilyticus]|uniref:PTS sugar transporter subunit IIA n=1 Tax=Caenibacillus caldisaponilyticus TaxID=1674942 RepID=UPI00098849F5|nr:PTS sugar transporter subunit IIA [Caenibacillus caldisaponilyticus]